MRYGVFPGLVAVLFGCLLLIEPPTAQGEQAEEVPPVPAGVEVQARGPVHEAFAEPTAVTGVAAVVVTKEPPAPVEEMPPEEKPAGDHVVWIPGYWTWDGETKDYLWISGFWRAVPPGRTWTPGHWNKGDAGWQFVSGFWGTSENADLEYLPPPPASLDQGPSVPAPQVTASYAPGMWIYQGNRYLWRPGYWVTYREGWVWTPAYYRWTPAGYIYISGYWDVPLLNRGLLFAPVRFVRAVLTRTFVYRPTYVIQPDFLIGALFVRTGRPCFYFGNYFEARYRTSYVSWWSYRPTRASVDLNFSYYRAAYVRYPDWERNLRTLYTARYEGTIARPPISLAQQTKVINNITINKSTHLTVTKNVNLTHLQNVTVLQPIKRVKTMQVTAMASLASNKPGFVKGAPIRQDVRMERITKERVREERRSVERYNAITRERRTIEAGMVKKPPTVGGASVKVKVNLPTGTPPARVIRAPVKPPPSPVHTKVDVKVNVNPKGPPR